jgi:hypothetical protein
MNPRIAALLVASVWMISLVLAGAIGWQLSPPRSETPRKPERDGGALAPPDALRSAELDRLREENASLRLALAREQGEPQPATGPREVASRKAIADDRHRSA